MLSSFDGVTLQKFQDATGTEITSGIIATGMKFALEIDEEIGKWKPKKMTEEKSSVLKYRHF